MLDKKELNVWTSHLKQTMSLFEWRHIVYSELTKHNRHVTFPELTNHSESDHSICTLAALLWKIAADAIQIVLLDTPETSEQIQPM